MQFIARAPLARSMRMRKCETFKSMVKRIYNACDCCGGEFALLKRSTQLKSKVEAKECRKCVCVVEACRVQVSDKCIAP